MWILGKTFSQDWDFQLQVFEVYFADAEAIKDYFENVVGIDSAKAGYIAMEGTAKNGDSRKIYIGIDTMPDLWRAYDRVCDSLISHNDVIDLRDIEHLIG